MEVNTKLIEEQKGYIREALDFVGVAQDVQIDVEIIPGVVENIQIVNWRVTGLLVPVAGSYQITTPGEAKLNVVMSLGLVQHPYGALIYAVIFAADRWFLQGAPDRNSLLEIAYREAVAEALIRYPYSVVERQIERAYHFEENREWMHGQWIMYQEAQKAKSNVLRKNGRKLL